MMRALKYLVGAAAASLLMAGSAQAAVSVDYTGLGFNGHPTQPTFIFSRLADDFGDFLGGHSSLDMPTDFSNLGQAVYTIDGTDLDNVGGLHGGTVTFGAATKSMHFTGAGGEHTLSITGGGLSIVNDPGPGCGFLNPCPQEPAVQLPTNLPGGDLGLVNPGYYLDGGLTIVVDGYSLTFEVCGSLIPDFCGDPYFGGHSDPLPFVEPFNTLNVGDNGGDSDVAMFLFLKSEDCVDERCVFYNPEVVTTTYKMCRPGIFGPYDCITVAEDCREASNTDYNENGRGILTGGAQTTTMVGFGGFTPPPRRCYVFEDRTKADHDVFLKLAVWGAEPQDAPEPATLSLLGLGLLGLGAAARRRRTA